MIASMKATPEDVAKVTGAATNNFAIAVPQ